MSLQYKHSRQARMGSILTEYGVVAALILIVTIPGIYLVGQQLQQWADGVKTDLAHHRDMAISASNQIKDKAGHITDNAYQRHTSGQDRSAIPIGGEIYVVPTKEPPFPDVAGTGAVIDGTQQSDDDLPNHDTVQLHNGKKYHKPQRHPTPPPDTGGSNADKAHRFP